MTDNGVSQLLITRDLMAGLILPDSFKPKLGKLVIEHIEDIENQLREL